MKAALEQQRMQNEIAAQDKQAQADAALAQYKAQLDSETAIKLKLIDVAGTAAGAVDGARAGRCRASGG